MAVCGMWIAIVLVMVFFAGVVTRVNRLSKAWLPIHWAHQDLAQRRIRGYAEDIILI